MRALEHAKGHEASWGHVSGLEGSVLSLGLPSQNGLRRLQLWPNSHMNPLMRPGCFRALCSSGVSNLCCHPIKVAC